MIYLDYAANSPVREEVLDEFYKVTKKYMANPNSNHKLGLDVKNMIDESTSHIAQLLNVKEKEIIYTSGASESNNLAIKGLCERNKGKGKHIITTPLEHTSVIAPIASLQNLGYEIDVLNILPSGLIDINELKKLLREDTVLVSVCSVDSEIGLVQPVEEIGLILKEYPNCSFHSDATQAIGKININFENIDLITIAPHKFYGLNGFGLLIKKEHIQLSPIILGGKSTTIYRSGTPVLGQIKALEVALELALRDIDKNYKYIKELNNYLREQFKLFDKVVVNSTKDSIPYTINISIKGVKSEDIQKRLEEYEVYVSTKAACCPTNAISKAVYAISKDKQNAGSMIRISLSYLTTNEELNKFIEVFSICYKELTDGKA